MTDYVVWGATPLGGYASFLPLDHVEDDYELKDGLSRAEGWPDDASFAMNPSYPRDVALADAVYTRGGDGLPVVSPALRAAIEAAEPPDVEYLPVRLIDHKGAVVAEDYVIAHSVHVVDALDHDAMGIEWNALDPMAIQTCDRMALREEPLAHAPALFRPRNFTHRVLVRRDVAEALEGFSGVFFDELDEVTD